MPGKRDKDRSSGKSSEAPRTDLPPRRDPYYEGYFGTEEEEGVVREIDAGKEGGEGEEQRGEGEEQRGEGEEEERKRGALDNEASGERDV